MSELFAAYPIATISAAGFYAALLGMIFGPWRRRLEAIYAHPTTTESSYSASLDAFRGVAALVVAAAHCLWFTSPVFDLGLLTGPLLLSGAKAVPMFAALSGFLIYRSVLRVSSVERLRTYLLRRATRIHPLYAVTAILAVIAGQAIAPDGRFGGTPLIVSDILMLRVLGYPFFVNPVTWSLYVEVLFYLVMPLCFLTIGRERFAPAALLAFVVFVFADQIPNREFQLWKFFLIGILASEVARTHGAQLSTIANPLAIFGIAMIAVDASGRFDIMAVLGLLPENTIGFTVWLAISLFVFLVALPHSTLADSVCRTFALRLIGTVSYSIFLIHPFFLLANFPNLLFVKVGQQTEMFSKLVALPPWFIPAVFLPGIIAWSMITYALIERPGIMIGRRRRQTPGASTSDVG